jgi:DNA-directed RNA polymerase specialized sigma24 family protein
MENVRALLVRAQRRDPEAVDKLIALLKGDITRVVMKVTRSREDGEQALQDALVRIFVYLPRFEQYFRYPIDVDDPAGDKECLDNLRKWSTNLARNWARTINRYGVVIASPFLIPSFVYKAEDRRKRRTLPQSKEISLDHGMMDNEIEDVDYTDLIFQHACKAGRGSIA